MSRRGSRSSTRNRKDGWEESGGYMNAKIQKLANQFEAESSSTSKCAGSKISDIFKGVSIFVNGYTKPPSDVLKKLMQQHGGVYHHYYGRTKVTHIIATNLPNNKIAALTDKKVVKPEWITDSIAACKLLSYEDYLLYTAKSNVQPSLKSKFTPNPSTSNHEASHLTDAATIVRNIQQESSLVAANDRKSTLSENCQFEDGTFQNEHVYAEDFDINEKDISNINEPSVTGYANTAQEKTQTAVVAESCLKTTETAEKSNTDFRSPAKAGDPSFVAEFYSHSRLHHISTWGAEFKAYVSSLQAKIAEFPAKDNLAQIAAKRLKDESDDNSSTSFGRVIMHIDMDCFFVSVGLRNKPRLSGKPVAVTHSRGKGAKNPSEGFHSMAEIASCSYEARSCGVKNGMFMGDAKKLCPNLVAIPYDFEGYNEVSKILYDCVASLTCDIEAVSCDELFVDCTTVLEQTGATPLQLASMIREEIYSKTKCPASAGLGPNILVSRLATRKAKPNGQHFVTADEVTMFMKDQAIGNLPGVGRKLRKRFENLRIATCEDLQNFDKATLQKHFGPKTADTFYKFSRGIDDRQIQSEKVRKSVSAEINYGIRFHDDGQADKFISEVAGEVTKRLKADGSKGKSITLKLKIRSADAPKETAKFLGHGKCDSVVKSVTLPLATDNVDVITKESLALLRSVNPDVTDIRGLGIQISKLEKPFGEKNKGLPSILQYTRKQEDISKQVSKTSPNTSISTSTGVTTRQNKNEEGMFKYLKESTTTKPVEHNKDICEQTENTDHQEIGETIADELPSDSQLRCTLPPLPCLPDILSPSPRLQKLAFQSSQDDSIISSSPEFTITPEATISTGSKLKADDGKTSAYHGVFPSPSQIDPDVLMALPADIRNEILNEQKRNKRKQQEEPQSVEPMAIDEQAGCSHWTGPQLPQTSPNKLLDLNTLKQAQATSPTKSPRGRGRGANSRGSPSNRGSNRSPKNSGRFKVPQGTARPNRGKQTGKSGNPKKQLFVDESHAESEQKTETCDIPVENQNDIQLEEKPKKEKPNLCGARTLEEVKALIKQWMKESPEPNEEDIIHFLTYLTELLEDKDLEQLLFTIRHLIRHAGRTKNALWESAANEIAINMQLAVQSAYGSTLKISV